MTGIAGVNGVAGGSPVQRLERPLPVEVEARRGRVLGGLERALRRPTTSPSPGGDMSAFCEPGDDDVDAPGIRLEGTAPRLEIASTTTSAPDGRIRAAMSSRVDDDAGRRLRVREEDRVRAADLLELPRHVLPARNLAPLVRERPGGRSRRPPRSPASARRSCPRSTTRTRSPGEHRLATAPSMQAVPEPA